MFEEKEIKNDLLLKSGSCFNVFTCLRILDRRRRGAILYESANVVRIALSRPFLEFLSNCYSVLEMNNENLENYLTRFIHNWTHQNVVNRNLNDLQLRSLQLAVLNWFAQNQNNNVIANFLNNNPSAIGGYVSLNIDEAYYFLNPIEVWNEQIRIDELNLSN